AARRRARVPSAPDLCAERDRAPDRQLLRTQLKPRPDRFRPAPRGPSRPRGARALGTRRRSAAWGGWYGAGPAGERLTRAPPDAVPTSPGRDPGTRTQRRPPAPCTL